MIFSRFGVLTFLVGYLTLLSFVNAISFREIQWKIATGSQDSHYSTCNQNSLLPYIPVPSDFEWNSTVLAYVVNDVLGTKILSSSYEGLNGCCSSSLWCISGEGCFTQNFGGSYVNYGWMRNTTKNIPVYSCISSSVSFGNLALDLATTDGIATNAPLFAPGDGASQSSAELQVQINGLNCPYGDVCQTFRCKSDFDCPFGMGCFNVSTYEDNLCYSFCSNGNDTSCPCGQTCVVSEGYASSAFFVCASDELQGGLPSSNTLVTCAPIGGLLTQLPTGGTTSFAVSSDLQGVQKNVLSLAVVGCTQDSTCIDYNPCTIDICIAGQCYHEPMDNQCDSMTPNILEQTTPFSYLTTFATSDVPSFASLYSQLSFSSRSKYIDKYVVIMDFKTMYFGNIVSSFVVDVYGILSFAPYIGCDSADQCVYYSSATNTISVGYDTKRSSSSAYSAYQVQWSDLNGDGHIDAVHVLFLSGSTASKPSSIVSIFEDGSIRMTYNTSFPINTNPAVDVENAVNNIETVPLGSILPFTGLWGAHAGPNFLYPGETSAPSLSNSQLAYASSPSRYYVNNASFVLASNGSTSSSSSSSGDTLTTTSVQVMSFCPYVLPICTPSSCLKGGDTLTLSWNGTDTCSSLTNGVNNVSFVCSWLGGLYQTSAVYTKTSSISYKQVQCAVPNIDSSILAAYTNSSIADNEAQGVLLSVNLLPFLNGEVIDAATRADSSKSTRAMYFNPETGELARGNLLIRYYPSSAASTGTCGCFPFTSSNTFASLTCASDSNICGGTALYGNVTTVVRRQLASNMVYNPMIPPHPIDHMESIQQHPSIDEQVSMKSSLPLLHPSHIKDTSALSPVMLHEEERWEVVDSQSVEVELQTTASDIRAKSYIFDCAGIAFGSAYLDACSRCSGGTTRRTPISPSGAAKGLCTADDGNSSNDNENAAWTIVTQTIILLMVICCLTFLTSAVTFSIRRMLLRRQTEQFLIENELALQQMMLGAEINNNGGRNTFGRSRPLTEFEREALGEVVFSPEFVRVLRKKETVSTSSSSSNSGGNTIALPASAADGVPASSSTSSVNSAGNALECPICLVEFSDGDMLRHLPDPCGHVFHRDCIDHWFKQSSQCPLCKRSMRAILTGTYDEREHQQQPASTNVRRPHSTIVSDHGNDGANQSRPQSHHRHHSAGQTRQSANINDNNSTQPQGYFYPQASPPQQQQQQQQRPTTGSSSASHHHSRANNNGGGFAPVPNADYVEDGGLHPHEVVLELSAGQRRPRQHQTRSAEAQPAPLPPQQALTIYGEEGSDLHDLQPSAGGAVRVVMNPEDRLRLEAARLAQQQQYQHLQQQHRQQQQQGKGAPPRRYDV